MRFLSVLLTAVLVALWATAAFGQRTREQYEQEREALPYVDRFDHAKNGLADSVESVVTQSLRDLLEFSLELPGRTEEALEAVEQCLSHSSEGTPLHQDAYYTRAWLLHRGNDKAYASSLFKEGISKGWRMQDGRSGMDVFGEALWENDPVMFPVETFNYAMEEPSGQGYLREGDQLRIFALNLLWPLRKKSHDFNAADDILPYLRDHANEKHHRLIAEAICLMIDERYDESVELLRLVDDSLSAAPENYDPADAKEAFRYNEELNIPLYVAAARTLQGDRGQARQAMEEFYQRNVSRPEYVTRRLMKIAYTLESAPASLHDRMIDITGFMLDKGLPSSEKVSRSQARHILDMHVGGCFRQRDWAKVKQYADWVLADYRPDDDASNNSLFCLGSAHRGEEEYEEAEAAFVRLMNEATFASSSTTRMRISSGLHRSARPAPGPRTGASRDRKVHVRRGLD